MDASDMPSIELPRFSVLMAVYALEEPSFFEMALGSILEQTLLPDEVILVCDGPLTPGLESVLSGVLARQGDLFKVIRLPENQGLGMALNAGLAHCQYELILRMDSDDYALPTRFEKQLAYLSRHPEVDLLSSTIAEFCKDPLQYKDYRVLPEDNEELCRFARLRNPMNHPAVAFRKSKVLEVGGYQHCLYFEDYYLWARMIMAGATLHNLPEPLLAFRLTRGTYRRRRGWRYVRSEWEMQCKFLSMGFVNPLEFFRNLLLRVPPRLVSRTFLKCIYKRFLRKASLSD